MHKQKRLIQNILSSTEALEYMLDFKNKKIPPFCPPSTDKINGSQFTSNNIPAHKVGGIIKKCIQAITNLT